jgi:pilus assembly protein CpaE
LSSNLSALIVDANLDSRLEAARALHGVGLDCAGEASYGTEALVMAADRSPNLVLLAFEEPPLRSIATLEALQQQLPDVPVITYSSSMSPTLMRQAMRAGARDFIERPLREQELRNSVHSVLAQEEQRQLGRWREKSAWAAKGTVLTVAGAKGGIGKTTITTNLAIALRMVTGQEVALVDADAQFGDVAVMLDMSVDRSIADLAREQAEINRTTLAPYLARHSSGIDVLLAGSEPEDWRALQPQHISAIVSALAENHEYVLLDTPGTMNEVVAASLGEAASVLLCTSLDVSSIKDTKMALRILHESWAFAPDRVQLIVNDNNRAAAVSVDDVIRSTGVREARLIRNEPNVGLSLQMGTPMVISHPSSAFSQSIMSLAETISGTARAKSEVWRPLARLRPSFLRGA